MRKAFLNVKVCEGREKRWRRCNWVEDGRRIVVARKEVVGDGGVGAGRSCGGFGLEVGVFVVEEGEVRLDKKKL